MCLIFIFFKLIFFVLFEFVIDCLEYVELSGLGFVIILNMVCVFCEVVVKGLIWLRLFVNVISLYWFMWL